MNPIKKSQAKTWIFLFAGILITGIAFLQHPSLKPMFLYNSQQEWQNLIEVLENSADSEAQELWKFREFYSRGTIYLAKYQTLETPINISSNFELPQSFINHTLFTSKKIQSIEGSVDETEVVFLSKEEIDKKNWTVLVRTDSVQIIENKKENKAIIIALFDLEDASIANGYLHFDFRNEDFKALHKHKKWLVVSFVSI